jgi:hypothetical protein
MIDEKISRAADASRSRGLTIIMQPNNNNNNKEAPPNLTLVAPSLDPTVEHDPQKLWT